MLSFVKHLFRTATVRLLRFLPVCSITLFMVAPSVLFVFSFMLDFPGSPVAMEKVDLYPFTSDFLSSTVYFSGKVFSQSFKIFTFMFVFLNSSHRSPVLCPADCAQMSPTLNLGWSQFRQTADCLVPSYTQTKGSPRPTYSSCCSQASGSMSP